MHLSLRMSLNCTVCGKSLNKPQDSADDDDLQRSKENASPLSHSWLPQQCPKCHQWTENAIDLEQWKNEQSEHE